MQTCRSDCRHPPRPHSTASPSLGHPPSSNQTNALHLDRCSPLPRIASPRCRRGTRACWCEQRSMSGDHRSPSSPVRSHRDPSNRQTDMQSRLSDSRRAMLLSRAPIPGHLSRPPVPRNPFVAKWIATAVQPRRPAADSLERLQLVLHGLALVADRDPGIGLRFRCCHTERVARIDGSSSNNRGCPGRRCGRDTGLGFRRQLQFLFKAVECRFYSLALRTLEYQDSFNRAMFFIAPDTASRRRAR